VSSELRFEGGGTSAGLILKPSPRARVMRLRVDSRSGAVTLTYPRRVSQRKVIEWAAKQRVWIEAALAKVPAEVPIAPGGELPVEGVPHRIDWELARSRVVKIENGAILVGGPLETLEARLFRWLKQRAFTVLELETREFAAKAGVTVSRVGVGDPKSRWGSCSSSGAIRYSWRLILAPDWVRRATVAHEVAHRVHMNHGPDFHALVEALLGTDPKPARNWLRREGAGLHRIGGALT
jgi:predicted metal-dependent hydrolase